jgi:hypothetical protein
MCSISEVSSTIATIATGSVWVEVEVKKCGHVWV